MFNFESHHYHNIWLWKGSFTNICLNVSPISIKKINGVAGLLCHIYYWWPLPSIVYHWQYWQKCNCITWNSIAKGITSLQIAYSFLMGSYEICLAFSGKIMNFLTFKIMNFLTFNTFPFLFVLCGLRNIKWDAWLLTGNDKKTNNIIGKNTISPCW